MKSGMATYKPGMKPAVKLRDIWDGEDLANLAKTKRFLERWMGDSQFREELADDMYGASQRYNLKADPKEIQILWDTELAQDAESINSVSSAVSLYSDFILKKLEHRRQMQTQLCVPDNPRYKAWRIQQIARTQNQLGPVLTEALVHAPVCFELSKGCSVGCWFCGVSAPPLENSFLHTRDNTKLWKEVLEVVREVIGAAAASGFCYWASDPLDNPEYEEFLLDFHSVLGNFPQTTTAQPMKYPQRVRDLLKLSGEKGGWIDRFSILSLKILNQVHQEFSPEELTFVELVPQNKEAIGMQKHVSGRAREYFRRKAKKNQEPYPDDNYAGTVACVTGFLFNMLDRSVKLISPCNADDRWPLGYRIYQQGSFTDGSSLKKLLEDMITNQMYSHIQHDDLIGFQRFLKYESSDEGFKLSSPHLIHKFSEKMGSQIHELGELIARKDKTAGDIALMLQKEDKPLYETFHLLNTLLRTGLIDDEPESTSIAPVSLSQEG